MVAAPLDKGFNILIDAGPVDGEASLPDSLKSFWSIKDRLRIDDLIVYGCHVLIPTSLHTTMLRRLHDARQGAARSQARVRLRNPAMESL